MSVTIRPYVNGGWEADIHVVLPDGTVIRERKKAPASSNTAAERWAGACERVLATHGKPKPISKQEVPDKPTLKEFGVPFPRALRESQPVEADRECREADDPAGPSRAGVRRQHTRRDHDRGCAADEGDTHGAITEDGQQRVDDAECGAEDGSEVGRHRASAVLDSVAPHAEKCRELLRFRRVRTARGTAR